MHVLHAAPPDKGAGSGRRGGTRAPRCAQVAATPAPLPRTRAARARSANEPDHDRLQAIVHAVRVRVRVGRKRGDPIPRGHRLVPEPQDPVRALVPPEPRADRPEVIEQESDRRNAALRQVEANGLNSRFDIKMRPCALVLREEQAERERHHNGQQGLEHRYPDDGSADLTASSPARAG